jgi:hypothetical protein
MADLQFGMLTVNGSALCAVYCSGADDIVNQVQNPVQELRYCRCMLKLSKTASVDGLINSCGVQPVDFYFESK